MLIRKLFKFEGAHVVRDCSSLRCKESIHGHSYRVEVKFRSYHVDNGQMVMDFGLMKTTIKEFIDAFDHTYVMWNREKKEYKDFIKENSLRWIELPVSPSAEMFAVMFYAVVARILWQTKFTNGERGIILHSVRVHETDTGWAEAFEEDYLNLWNWNLGAIKISDQIKDEWKDSNMWDKILSGSPNMFVNPEVDLKYVTKED